MTQQLVQKVLGQIALQFSVMIKTNAPNRTHAMPAGA